MAGAGYEPRAPASRGRPKKTLLWPHFTEEETGAPERHNTGRVSRLAVHSHSWLQGLVPAWSFPVPRDRTPHPSPLSVTHPSVSSSTEVFVTVEPRLGTSLTIMWTM